MADQGSGFGARIGGISELAGALTGWLQSLGEEIRAMLADSGEAWGRMPQAAALLTDHGEKGPVAAVLLQAALMIAAALLAALMAWLALAAIRRRIADEQPRTLRHRTALFLRALSVELAPPA